MDRKAEELQMENPWGNNPALPFIRNKGSHASGYPFFWIYRAPKLLTFF